LTRAAFSEALRLPANALTTSAFVEESIVELSAHAFCAIPIMLTATAKMVVADARATFLIDMEVIAFLCRVARGW
jgi:hypothetical protein